MDEAFVRDFFSAEGMVSIRRMFGGHGVYIDDRIVAIILRDELLLKTDERTAPYFEAAGAKRWRYDREGKTAVEMPYHSVPSEALDDPDAMAVWARRAVEAASRTPRKLDRPRGRSRSA